MELFDLLMQQNMEVLAPTTLAALVVLNQVLKTVFAVIRIGIVMSCAGILCMAVPYLS